MQPKQLLTSLKDNRRKIAVFVLICTVLLLVASSLLVPVITKQQVEKQIFALTGRVATVEKITFNPFGLTLTASGFNCFEQDKKTSFFRFDSLKVSVSASSLLRRAIVVDLLQLEKPELRLVYLAPHNYNFNDIQQLIASLPKEEKSSSTRFSINNISISNGDITFINQTVKTPVTHRVQELGLGIPFISNIPYLAEKYTDPYLHAQLDGAKLSFTGHAKPLAEAMEATLDLKLDKLALAQFQSYIPSQLPIKLADGLLTLDWNLAYRVHKNKTPELLVSGLSRLDNLDLQEQQGSPLLKFRSLELLADQLEFFSQHYDFKRIALHNPEAVLARDKKGKLNFQRLFKADKKQSSSKQGKQDENKVFFAVKELVIDEGDLKFKDLMPLNGFSASLSAINLQAKDIDTKAGHDTTYKLSLQGDKGESLTANGSLNLVDNSYESKVTLSGLGIQRGWPYLQQYLAEPIDGTIKLAANASYNNADGLLLKDSSLQLLNLAIRYGDDKSSIADLALDGISYQQKDNRLEVSLVKLGKGSLQITREPGGKLSPTLLLAHSGDHESIEEGGSNVLQEQQADQHEQPVAGKKAFSYRIADLFVNGLGISFKDRAVAGEPIFKFNNIQLKTGNLDAPKFAAMPFDLSATYGRRAPLAIKGVFNPKPFSYKGVVEFSRLPIKEFTAYLPERLNVALLAGQLDSKARLNIHLPAEGKLAGSFGGTFGLRRFHAVDKQSEEDLLRWESLQLDRIRGKLQPFSLDIREIALNGVYSRIAIHKDGSLNLQNLMQKEPQVQAAKQEPEHNQEDTLHEVAQNNTTAEKGLIRINAVTIQEGILDFSDEHLSQPFRTKFYNLGGRVSSLSSEMNTHAEVDLRGNLENRSPLQITGTINPLRDDLFMDLVIGFKDVELAPTTPYSGTYLGYAIDRGKLYLDLKYHIDNKRLAAENKVLIDQLTFGDAVASDKALNLPVKLGVALLKDRNGQIKLDLPVSGRTDDPQFSVWGVVWDVVKNLFVKAVTSPFSLLASVLGSGADELSDIVFSPGSSLLTTHEAEKLSLLTKILIERPALKVQISGFADQENDPEGYRNEQLLLKMRQAKLLSLNKGRKRGQEKISVDQVEILPEEEPVLLKAVYGNEKFPKPRNMVGMVKTLPDDEMRKLIFANTIVGEQELKQLAANRAVAVQQHLANSGVDLQRLFLKREDIYRKPAKGHSTASRVELTPIVQ